MNPTQLASDFSGLYATLKLYTHKAAIALKKDIDHDELISECYLYIHEHLSEITSTNQLEAWSKRFIKMSLYWNNSAFLRMVSIRSEEGMTDNSFSSTTSMSEEWITYKVKSFEASLDTYDKGLFNIYFNLDLKTGKAIAKHLNVSTSTGYGILRECKALDKRFRTWLLAQLI